MIKIKFLIVILFYLLTPSLSFGDVSIFTGLYTKHFNNNSELNENNQIVGIKYNNWAASTFVNSSFKRSHFLARQWKTNKLFVNHVYLRGNLYFGFLYGYGEYVPNVNGWSLALSPTFEIGYKNISVETLVMPFDGGVITILLNYNF